MNARDPEEQELANAIKVARTAIRLKHSIAADSEINTKLPQIERSVRKFLAQGKGWKMLPESLKVIEDA